MGTVKQRGSRVRERVFTTPSVTRRVTLGGHDALCEPESSRETLAVQKTPYNNAGNDERREIHSRRPLLTRVSATSAAVTSFSLYATRSNRNTLTEERVFRARAR